jgi:hypothetical protein
MSYVMSPSENTGMAQTHTPRLVEALLDRLELRLELLVLGREASIGVLQQSLQVLDPLVSCKQLSLGNAGFLLQRGVLVYELTHDQLSNPVECGKNETRSPASVRA